MQWNISLIKGSLVFIPWVPFTAASVCGRQKGLYFFCLHAFLPCAVLTRVQITNGDLFPKNAHLCQGKQGAQTRRLLTWGMLPSSWVCGSKHTNLCKGVSRGWGHWPEAPCSTWDWETCNARFNKWSLFFYETGIIIQVVRTRGLPVSELRSVPEKVLERGGKMQSMVQMWLFFLTIVLKTITMCVRGKKVKCKRI